jgi:hypothetical protein
MGGRLRRFGKWLVFLLLAGVAWTTWAGYAVYDLATALRDFDPIALERRVDWPAVQQGLREDLASASALHEGITRQSVARAVQSARFDGTGTASDPLWSRIEYVGYTGGPFAFRVDLKPGGDSGDGPMTLLFKWSGDWRLARVFPPGAASASAPFAERVGVFPAPPPSPSPASLPAEPPRLSEASTQAVSGPKAVLFEEDPADPQGKRYDGSVSWQTELTPAAGESMREPVVRADVSVPGRLAMTLWLRRNADRTLPASHVIELKFELPANSSTGGIHEVPAIMLKDGADGRGSRLAAISVNIAQNLFLVGLSAIEHDVDHNVRMLRDRSWLDIPIAYKSRNRAVLAIEKGAIGEKVIADALTYWSRVAVSEKEAQKKQ